MTPHVCERTPADFSFRHADKNLHLQVIVSFSLVSRKGICLFGIFFFSNELHLSLLIANPLAISTSTLVGLPR